MQAGSDAANRQMQAFQLRHDFDWRRRQRVPPLRIEDALGQSGGDSSMFFHLQGRQPGAPR